MKNNRPHLVAKKSLFPIFWSFPNLFFVIFAALAVFMHFKGDTISSIASLAPTLTIVFGALAGLLLLAMFIWALYLRSTYIKFYDTYVVKHTGLLSKHTQKCMLPKIISCNVDCSFWGRIFKFGDVRIDTIGRWDIDLLGYKRPNRIRRRLERNFITPQEVKAMRQTIVSK